MHAHAPRTLTLQTGETAPLPDGSQLTYLRLLNDSRCPPGKQCIWAGDAEIALRWQPATGSGHKLRLHANPQHDRQVEAALGGHRVRLQALAHGDAPAATLVITPVQP